MTDIELPKFIIKKNLQKSQNTGIYTDNLLTRDNLSTICTSLTNCTEFEVQFVENDYEDDFVSDTYNKGRLALLHYNKKVMYITFSEKKIASRNSSVQSVPSAYNMFYLNNHQEKELYYFFLDNIEGNYTTDYHKFMYRLMKTSGFNFINDLDMLGTKVEPFYTIEDLIASKSILRQKTKGNSSSYITKNITSGIEIYGKTFGSNKYETSLICYAALNIMESNKELTLFQVPDNNLSTLPKSSLEVLNKSNSIKIEVINTEIEQTYFESSTNLRSRKYIYNLLDHIGDKKCTMCDCDLPELIQGAHVWPVADIKHQNTLSYKEQYNHAINKNNGIWLCSNHHKLFDSHLIQIDSQGNLSFIYDNLLDSNKNYINTITNVPKIKESYLNDEFIFYLNKRNSLLQEVN